MIALLYLVLGAVAGLLVQRAYNVPRDIRRHDERIRNRDEDLITWIEDDQKQLRRETITLNIADSRGGGREMPPYLVAFQQHQLKDQVLHRYRDQLRDAERVARDVELSEQLPHRLMRRALRWPVPALTAPVVKADAIEGWKTPADEAFKVRLKKISHEFGDLGATLSST